jgi:hypothetical protein
MGLRNEMDTMSNQHLENIEQAIEQVRDEIGDVTMGAVANFISSWIEATDQEMSACE